MAAAPAIPALQVPIAAPIPQPFDNNDVFVELSTNSTTFIGDTARSLDTNAGIIIAGVAGVQFSQHVWTRDVDNDFELNTYDEDCMRKWVWQKLLPAVVLPVNKPPTNLLKLRRIRPLRLGVNIMNVIKAFKTAERVVSKKALSPMALACALEAVHEICSMQAMRGLAAEDEKDSYRVFCAETRVMHPHSAPTLATRSWASK
jgi:hypothetical protein